MFHWQLFCSALLIVIVGSFHVGYQSSTSNGASIAINKFFYNATGTDSTLLFSSYSSCLMLSGVIGALAAPIAADRFGRKTTLVIICILELFFLAFGIAGSFIVSTVGVVFMFVMRLGMGAMCAAGMTVQSAILTESAPISLRGAVNTLSGAFIQGGFTFGLIVASPSTLGTDALWPYLQVIEAGIVALDLLGLVLFCHESPAWLILHNKLDKARKAVGFYHSKPTQETDLVVRDMAADLNSQSKDVLSVAQIFTDPIIRKGMLIGSTVCLIVAFSGLFAMNFFCVQLLTDTGFDDAVAANITIGIGAVGTAMCVVTYFLIEKLGRRPLLIISCIGCLIGNIIMMVMGLVNKSHPSNVFGYIFIVAEIIFFSSFVIGLGPLAVSYTVELVPQSASAKSQSIAMVVWYFFSFLTPIIFMQLNSAVGFYCFLLFIIPLIAAIIFCWVFTVETKNKTLSEIQVAMGAPKAGKNDMELRDSSPPPDFNG